VSVPVCADCGNFGVAPKHDSRAAGIVLNSTYANQSFCHYCKTHGTIVMVDMPCGFRTVHSEQQALHINMKIDVSEKLKQRAYNRRAGVCH
jgi:hypothetical protein